MIRQIQANDFSEIYDLVKATGTLDVHHPYTYWIMFNHSPEFCHLQELDGKIVGFVTGMKGFGDTNSVFLWQIGVLPDYQQHGIGTRLAEKFLQDAFSSGTQDIYFTIAPDNQSSIGLFEKVAGRMNRRIEVEGSTGNQNNLIKEEAIFRLY